METLSAGFETSTFTPFSGIALRLLMATLLGAMIGFEREWNKRPAGLRTHILVCLAAATAAVLTIEITHATPFGDESVKVDPVRLIEAVTAGVAFLAAGFIVFSRGEVHGLTTAAGMWLAGAVGLACGLGFWQIALLSTLLGIAVLWMLRLLEARFGLNAHDSPSKDEGSADDRQRD
ncbi:MAG: MgtC/SapB family protein [Rhizobiaceae bacterium]|jgi:putative Mg2+ transporter-C (MgtC) family protein|nr:MgtC/SapB family protein [Rhizobiaceae bacterium]MBO6724415.1 MgtC/SapB family protein [Rhizobiaceae bacterium]